MLFVGGAPVCSRAPNRDPTCRKRLAIRNGLAAPGSDGFLRRPCGGSLVVRPPLAFMLFGNPCRRRGTPDRPHAPSPPGDLRAAFQHLVPCSVGAAPLSARLREGISARGGRFPSPRTWIRRPRQGPSFVYRGSRGVWREYGDAPHPLQGGGKGRILPPCAPHGSAGERGGP